MKHISILCFSLILLGCGSLAPKSQSIDVQIQTEINQAIADLYATAYADFWGGANPVMMEKLERDRSKAERARKRLVEIGGLAVPQLVEALDRANWHDKRIPNVLVQINDPACIPALLDAARQQKDCVFDALVHFQVLEAVPIMIDILGQKRQPETKTWDTQQSAADALKQLTGQDFGWHWSKTPEEKKSIIAMWTKWWNENKKKALNQGIQRMR